MGEDIIQSFIEALEGLPTSVGGGSVAILAVAAIFVGIRLGKRLLHSASSSEECCEYCGRETYGDACYCTEGQKIEDGEVCRHCGRETGGDACYCSEGNMADSMEAAAEGIDENGQFVEEHGLVDSDKAGLYEEYHELLDSGDSEGAKQLAEENSLDVDWDQHTRDLIQEVINRGDFALADSMCDEAGIDKLELDWH